MLDADEVQELAAEARGLDADDIAGMTRNELRAALKASRDQLAAKDRVLQDNATEAIKNITRRSILDQFHSKSC